MTTTLKDRRIGITRIPIELINHDPDTVRAFMADVIVVKADFQVEHDRVEYVVICDDFPEVRPAEAIPFYTALFHRGTDGRVLLTGWNPGA